MTLSVNGSDRLGIRIQVAWMTLASLVVAGVWFAAIKFDDIDDTQDDIADIKAALIDHGQGMHSQTRAAMENLREDLYLSMDSVSAELAAQGTDIAVGEQAYDNLHKMMERMDHKLDRLIMSGGRAAVSSYPGAYDDQGMGWADQ